MRGLFTLTIILAVGIYAILVIYSDPTVRRAPPEVNDGDDPAALAAAEEPDDALHQGADGQLLLRTRDGEEIAIDAVIEPADAEDEVRTPPSAAPDATAPETPGPDTADPAAPVEAAEAPAGDERRLRVTGDRVNFRAGPSTNDAILTALTRGEEVALIELAADGWAHLRVVATGLEGYMSTDFLEPVN